MPASWDGMAGERLTIAEQMSHVADIEVEYHHRFQRLLTEDNPELVTLDGERMAIERSYATADCRAALDAFASARARTLQTLSEMNEKQLNRRGSLVDFGQVSVAGLVHHLCEHDHLHYAATHWLLGQLAVATSRL